MSGETDKSAASSVAFPCSRMIIQQCLSAKLEVRPAAADGDAEFVQVGFNQSINEVTDAGTEVPLYPYLECKHKF